MTDQGKPRIMRHGTGWRCTSKDGTGFGGTPLAAYRSWQIVTFTAVLEKKVTPYPGTRRTWEDWPYQDGHPFRYPITCGAPWRSFG